jgi:hypothetical protein
MSQLRIATLSELRPIFREDSVGCKSPAPGTGLFSRRMTLSGMFSDAREIGPVPRERRICAATGSDSFSGGKVSIVVRKVSHPKIDQTVASNSFAKIGESNTIRL